MMIATMKSKKRERIKDVRIAEPLVKYNPRPRRSDAMLKSLRHDILQDYYGSPRDYVAQNKLWSFSESDFNEVRRRGSRRATSIAPNNGDISKRGYSLPQDNVRGFRVKGLRSKSLAPVRSTPDFGYHRSEEDNRRGSLTLSVTPTGSLYDSRRSSMKKSLDLMGYTRHDRRRSTKNDLDLRSINESRNSNVTDTSERWAVDTDAKRHVNPNTKVKRRRATMLGAKWRRLCSFLTIFFKLWRHHARKVQNFLETNVDLIEIEEPVDLMFDVTEYRADKQARVSAETIRILKTRPVVRTEEEVKYVQVALGNYETIAEYPLRMTKIMAAKSWYEKYDKKRIIIQEGHPARCYYFILSGSVVVSKLDTTGVSTTVCFLNRGESFGELGLINNAPRMATVISKEPVELLVFSDDDYIDIFMSGGLKNPDDPFLKSLWFFQDWPIEILGDNPQSAFLSYFKRGSVLVRDSNYNDWIFIIKSGSCKVLKKLKRVTHRLPNALKEKQDREEAEKPIKAPDLNEADHKHYLQERLDAANERMEDRSLTYRQRLLGDLGLGIETLPIGEERTNDWIDEVAKVNRVKITVTEADENTVPQAEEVTVDKHLLRPSNKPPLPLQASKGPFLTKLDNQSNPPTATDTSKNEETKPDSAKSVERLKDDLREKIRKRRANVKQDKRTITDEINERFLHTKKKITAADKDPEFVEALILTKGMVFGLGDIVHIDQPSLSLVSNGSECILIKKKFYTEHMPKDFRSKLIQEVSPYPDDDHLQGSLQIYVNWIEHKSRAQDDALLWNKMKKVNVHDARSTLGLRFK